MTNFDVERDMRRANLIDQKIESLLRGTAPAAGDHLANELAFMRLSLSETFPLPVISEHIEDAHLARMMAAGVPAPAFVASEVVPDRTRPLETLKASFSQKVAAATLAVSTAFGGAAYAGVLPDPIQRAVAKVASVVGLNLPGAEDDALAEDGSRGGLDTELGDEDRGISPALEDHDDERDRSDADEDEDRRDDERDAREDAEDDAEDRRGDETDQREDKADDERDVREDAEDEAEDRRDEAEDRADDEIDQREDEADDERDAQEDAEEDAADEAEESREQLEELEEETRNDSDELGEDGFDADESGSGDDESDA